MFKKIRRGIGSTLSREPYSYIGVRYVHPRDRRFNPRWKRDVHNLRAIHVVAVEVSFESPVNNHVSSTNTLTPAIAGFLVAPRNHQRGIT
jgi:hypothetical protein